MAHNETTIGNLLKSGDEQAAADELLELLERNNGNVVHASLEVGVHHATVKRWLARLDAAGWNVRARLASMRTSATDSTALSAAERETIERRNRDERERARVMAFAVEVETDDNLALELASGLDLSVAALRRDLQTIRAGSKVRGKVWLALVERVRRRREQWRMRRETRVKRSSKKSS